VSHSRSLAETNTQDAWLTIGVFDGVHRGHQAIIRRLADGAHAQGSPAVVLTFDPHPAVVLGGLSDFKLLTPPVERAALLAGLGVDEVVTLTFDRRLASRTADDFMGEVTERFGLRRLLVGYDFALGRGRQGDATRLAEIGRELGYSVDVIPALAAGGEAISSTRIRRQLAEGQVEQAASALGRPYSVGGPVVHGDGRGRKINIPTANIAYQPVKCIPANGIYATWAVVGGERYAAATNIGVNPTFTPDKTTPNLEAHLLDFSGYLYGQEVEILFIARLRDEIKFASVDALLAQIGRDIEQTRQLLG